MNLPIEEQILSNITFEAKDKLPIGGQHCGLIRSAIVLKCKDLDIDISIGYFRSQLKNQELALDLLKYAISKIER